MQADEQTLSFDCQAENKEAAARIRWVLDDHLGRFSHKEALTIAWHAVVDER